VQQVADERAAAGLLAGQLAEVLFPRRQRTGDVEHRFQRDD
jgi:hypothetical protein